MPSERARSRRSPGRWGLAAAAGIALLAGAAWFLRSPPLPRIGEIRPLRLDVGPDFRGSSWTTWATDGVRLYYVVLKGGHYRLYHAGLSGGEPAEIPTPFGEGLEVYGYLRRHSALIVLGGPVREGRVRVWLLPLPRGEPRPVGNLAANFIAVSPDEERLALSLWEEDSSRIVVLPLDDPQGAPLAEVSLPGPVKAHFLRWSPDGDSLRFTAGAPVPGEPGPWIWETSPPGEDPRPLFSGAGGTWTEDGRHFVFERQDWAARRSDLHVVSERAWRPWTRREPVPLTNGPIGFSEIGVRGDGGGLVAYGGLSKGELVRFDRRSGRSERIFGGESLGMVGPSPDGQWIAWVLYPEGTLWRSRPDGSQRLQLTDPPASALAPGWSPDGAKIAFVGVSWTYSLRVVPADGGPVELLADPEGGVATPCWLRDGSGLVFSHLGQPGLLTFDLATREIHPLPGAEELLYPRCGPEGQLVALRPAEDAGSQAWMVHWPGSAAWEEVGLGALHEPSWTRDGRSFCGLQEDRVDCYSFDTKRLETVAEIGNEPVLVWPFTLWWTLDADDNPLVTFDRSTRDLYALDWETP